MAKLYSQAETDAIVAAAVAAAVTRERRVADALLVYISQRDTSVLVMQLQLHDALQRCASQQTEIMALRCATAFCTQVGGAMLPSTRTTLPYGCGMQAAAAAWR